MLNSNSPFGEKDFYELIKIYEQKPSIQIIKDEFNEFLENLNKDPEYKCYLEVYNYKDSDFDLEDETKEAFKANNDGNDKQKGSHSNLAQKWFAEVELGFHGVNRRLKKR